MKTDEPKDGVDDPELSALLGAWQTDAALPPRFNEQVWHRIARTEASSEQPATFAARVAQWVAAILPRRVPALAYVAVLLVIGAGAGWGQARLESARVNSDLGERYVKSIDPYQPARRP